MSVDVPSLVCSSSVFFLLILYLHSLLFSFGMINVFWKIGADEFSLKVAGDGA